MRKKFMILFIVIILGAILGICICNAIFSII